MRSRGRGEAARAAALATAGGPFEPTEQQLQLQRVSGVTAQPAMHAMLLSNNNYRTSWLPSLPSRLQHHITLESCTMVPGLRQHHSTTVRWPSSTGRRHQQVDKFCAAHSTICLQQCLVLGFHASKLRKPVVAVAMQASKRAASSQSLMDEIKASKSSLRDLQH